VPSPQVDTGRSQQIVWLARVRGVRRLELTRSQQTASVRSPVFHRLPVPHVRIARLHGASFRHRCCRAATWMTCLISGSAAPADATVSRSIVLTSERLATTKVASLDVQWVCCPRGSRCDH